MMLYNSEFLSIEKKGGTLVQKWNKKNLSIENFQKELYSFLEVYLKVEPNSVLWLQEDFNFQVPEDLYNWIDEEILARQLKNGIKDIAFTISKDKTSHLSVVDTFNEIKEKKKPRFFFNEKDALDYLLQKKYDEKHNKVHYTLTPKNDRVEINLETSYDALPNTINSISSLKSQINFVKENILKFKSLTQQEVQVLKLVCQGHSTKEIGTLLFIEASTVSTHRKKINKKLEAKSCVDLYRYGLAFNLVAF